MTIEKTNLTLADFDFNLPKELIAQEPISNKNSTKLLEIKDGCYKDYTTNDLLCLIKPNDLLIVNNTKVIKSRLLAKKGVASFIVTLHKALPNGNWLAFTTKTKRLHPGNVLELVANSTLKILSKNNTGEIEVAFKGNTSLDSFLENYGFMPLPPYIKRKNINNQEDLSNYQSIFAKNKGAVAAPTASLHFSEELLNKIKQNGTKVVEVTLHVGAGTFLPVKTTIIKDHIMHSEYGEVSAKAANLIKETKDKGGRIIAVGTTTLRILEHVAKIHGNIVPFKGETNIFIYPGFKFKVVDKLITNFHTPKSSLFMLVCAFAGIDNIKQAYAYAISKNYRFFSYGDCTLLHKDH